MIGMFSKQLLISFHSGRSEAFELTHCVECLHSAGVLYVNQREPLVFTNQGPVLLLFCLSKLINQINLAAFFIVDIQKLQTALCLHLCQDYKNITEKKHKNVLNKSLLT